MNAKLAIYEGLKPLLLATTAIRADGSVMHIKTVEIWRNNLSREKVEQPKQLPAVFIEFLPTNFKELTGGLQSYDLTTRLHIVFESYKDEDTDVLKLTDEVYRTTHYSQFGYAGKMKRRSEEQDFDHDNVQDYIQDYDCGKVMEFAADKRPTVEATIEQIILNGATVAPTFRGIGAMIIEGSESAFIIA